MYFRRLLQIGKKQFIFQREFHHHKKSFKQTVERSFESGCLFSLSVKVHPGLSSVIVQKKCSLKTTREQTTCISQNLQESAVLLWSKNSAPFRHLSERWVASQSNWTLNINQWRTHSKNNSYLCSINCQTSTSGTILNKNNEK